MTPERWEQISEIYSAAQKFEKGEQKIFLEKACAGDEVLLREVESLLSANSKAADFIAKPAINNFASLLTINEDSLLTGKTLGNYEILSQIGKGGMGEVYLAIDKRLDRQVALKTLPLSLSSRTKFLRRFETESKAAAALNHPNVATVYSVEEVDGQPFFTMEYVEGKTLDSLISADGLEIRTFLEWFIQIADAISHAHEKGIIHRDIKPGNIMITPDELPKILDFGLAQIDKTKVGKEHPTLEITHPGQILGTPSYMSPEQAEGKDIDQCSDIFSFGVVMYEAITGNRPFQGDSYVSVVNELLTKTPHPISEIKPETPYFLVRLIMRCLEKSRRRRFGSMREVRAILQEIQAAVEAGISMDLSSERLLKKAKKPPGNRTFVSLSVIIIALVSVAGFLFVQNNSTPPPISFENMTIRKLSQTNDVVYAHITPDGKSVAFNTIKNDEKRTLSIRRVEDKNSLELLPPQSVFFWGGLTISDDGSRIFYITAERAAPHGTLYSISSLGGVPRKLLEKVNDLGSLSPDGERVLFVRYGEEMQILSANAADGGIEQVIHTGQSNHIFRDPQFSSDGKSIFFIKFERVGGEELWSLVEIPATGGQEKIILPSRKPKISEIAVLKDGSGLLINAVETVSNLPQLFHISLTDGKQTRITNDLNSYFGISVSNDGKTIAAAQRQFSEDIWVYSDADTDQGKKLTDESNIYSTAVWTPDGRIVYDAVDNNRPHIWIVNDDGSNPQQLTPNDSFDFEPRVSPDGRFIVFTSERTGEKKVWRMNIDGSSPQLLAPPVGTAFGPVITPDGQTVLFQWRKENQRVSAKIPITGGEITEQTVSGEIMTAISPDGTQAAAVFFDEKDKRYKVGVRPFESKDFSIIYNISPLNILVWTSDGKGLLYRELEISSESNSTIWFQPVNGGEPKPFLAVKPETVFNISQSGDGKKTAVIRGKLLTDAVLLAKLRTE